MNYDFSLDKKGVVSVLASWLIMAALLFVAGMIVGTYWTAASTSAAAASGKGTNTARADSSTTPLEPVRPADAAQFYLGPPKLNGGSGGATTPGASAAQGARGSQAAPPSAAAAPGQNASPPDQSAGDKAANPAAAKDAEEKPQNAGAGAANQNVVETQLYTVEVGTFLEANEANRLFRSLQRQGYAPTFFSDRDGENRQWYSIRIGAYSDKQQAENAAANFTKQEKIKAVVRPLGSL